jgi:hypothetical protein
MAGIREPIEVVRRKAARGEELTKNEQRRLNKWWAAQRSNPVTPEKNAPTSYKAAALGFNISVPRGLHCFKCKKPLDEVTATFGKITQFSRFDVVDFKTARFETKIYAKNQRVAACADCCTLIKPLKDKAHALEFKSYE